MEFSLGDIVYDAYSPVKCGVIVDIKWPPKQPVVCGRRPPRPNLPHYGRRTNGLLRNCGGWLAITPTATSRSMSRSYGDGSQPSPIRSHAESPMKILVTFKDPDTLHDAVTDAFERADKPVDLEAEEWKMIRESRRDSAVDKITADFMEYGEYITIEFDTEARTARVVPRREK
jgi:hypothetical protein